MKYSCLILVMLGLAFFNQSRAQEPSEDLQAMHQRADSLQRIMMRDSLGISDSIITSVFKTRDQYKARVEEIVSDTSFSIERQGEMLADERAKTDALLRQILSEEIYEQYVALIRNILNDNPARKGEPLMNEENL